ncbi:MAG: hypothetical protein WBC04_10910 [Candidatus Acidiferrales bacterium]
MEKVDFGFRRDEIYDHSGDVGRVHADASGLAPHAILQAQRKRQAGDQQFMSGFQMRGHCLMSENDKDDLYRYHTG